jgi:peptide/nickel transport system substrate-binding protein
VTDRAPLRPICRVLAVTIGVCALAVTDSCRPISEAPVDGRVTLRIGTALPEVSLEEGVNWIVNALARESLVSVDWEGRPVPRLAQRIELLKGGSGVRLILRPEVNFHNGQPVDAPTVVRLLQAEIAKVGLGAENVKDIAAEGKHTVVINYRRPDSFILTDLNLYLIADASKPEMSTGPFKVTGSTQPIRLEAFDNYYRGRPAIDTIEIKEYETPRAAWSALMRGEVNFLHEVSRDAIDFVEEAAVETFPLVRPYYLALVFNMRHTMLRRREVRVALNEAVDRDAIVREGMWGRGRPAYGPIWPFHWAFSAGQRAYAFNPDAARIRLDAAGLRPAHQGKDRMASRFRVRCLIPSDDSRVERIALVLQRQLAEINVDLQLVPVPVKQMVESIIKGEFDTFLYEMTSGRTLSWVNRFWHSPSAGTRTMFDVGYHAADEPLDRIRSAQSDAEIRVGVADLHRAFYEDPPAVFLAWPHEARAIDNSFTVPYERDRDVIGQLWQARPVASTGAERR